MTINHFSGFLSSIFFKRSKALVIGMSLFCGVVFGQNPKRSLTIDDLMKMKTISSPEVSPDGAWVAYALSESDMKKDKIIRRIYIIPSIGGQSIPITSADYSASEPKWSPDNQYLSFLSSHGENEKTQVWTSNRKGGDAVQLTHIPQGVEGHAWSPTENKILLRITDPKPEELTKDKADDKKARPYVIDRLQFKQDYVGYLDRYRTHLYVLKMGDSTALQITSGDYDDTEPAWSPDGKNVAFVSNRSDNPDGNANTDIWVVAADNREKGQSLTQLTKNPNEDDSPAWSPDGKFITYKTVTDGELMWYASQQLAIVPSGGGTTKLLTGNLDRNISKPRYSADGKLIYFMLEENGSSNLGAIDPAGKDLVRVLEGEFGISDYCLSEQGIFPIISKANEPGNIYSHMEGQLKILTHENEALLTDIKNPRIEKFNFKSADGTPVEGFAVMPIDFEKDRKYPTILWIHGGPASQYDFSFGIEPQAFAANGYVTLLINPRGSTGYGQAFSQAIFADWGNLDYQDVMAGVDHAIASGYADPEKLAVGVWSYGGILTNYVITKTDRFRAAISGASEALYRANYGHDHYQFNWEKELGLPWENAELWEKLSPFNQVANISTPTLWMGGSNDWNVPILNSEQMYQAMKRLGKDTQLVVYPEEHHGIRKPSFVKDRLERYLQWFDSHVK